MNPISLVYISNTPKKLSHLISIIAGVLCPSLQPYLVEIFIYNMDTSKCFQTSIVSSLESQVLESQLRFVLGRDSSLPRAILLSQQIEQRKRSFCLIYKERRKSFLQIDLHMDNDAVMTRRLQIICGAAGKLMIYLPEKSTSPLTSLTNLSVPTMLTSVEC